MTNYLRDYGYCIMKRKDTKSVIDNPTKYVVCILDDNDTIYSSIEDLVQTRHDWLYINKRHKHLIRLLLWIDYNHDKILGIMKKTFFYNKTKKR